MHRAIALPIKKLPSEEERMKKLSPSTAPMKIWKVVLLTSFVTTLSFADDVKPKYGPTGAPRATPIAFSNEYFRTGNHPAPDFWALIGYYIPQMNEHSCSSATLAMVLNAARVNFPKTADDKVVSENELLDKVTTEHWKELLSAEGYQGEHGTSLDRFGRIAEAAFKAYGFPSATVRVVHAENTPEAMKALTTALEENEKSVRDFIVANFNQQAFTDDADAGHMAPVAAYDVAKKKVLILDPDRQWYEPYWVSVDTFMAGMATTDKTTNANRGYVVINLGS